MSQADNTNENIEYDGDNSYDADVGEIAMIIIAIKIFLSIYFRKIH